MSVIMVWWITRLFGYENNVRYMSVRVKLFWLRYTQDRVHGIRARVPRVCVPRLHAEVLLSEHVVHEVGTQYYLGIYKWASRLYTLHYFHTPEIWDFASHLPWG